MGKPHDNAVSVTQHGEEVRVVRPVAIPNEWPLWGALRLDRGVAVTPKEHRAQVRTKHRRVNLFLSSPYHGRFASTYHNMLSFGLCEKGN
eukprot:SAG11_NODE_20395_length_446_cov_0.896254_1_plen_90_part_00